MIMMMMMVMILLTKAMPNSEFVIRIGSLIIYLCMCMWHNMSVFGE